jgi:hypothetical protein
MHWTARVTPVTKSRVDFNHENVLPLGRYLNYKFRLIQL